MVGLALAAKPQRSFENGLPASGSPTFNCNDPD
jgi:hypothetical protein